MVLLYWSIGRDLSQRFATEGWGSKINERLASDPQAEFPGVEGFSPRNFRYMRALAEAWPEPEILQSLIAKLPWGHMSSRNYAKALDDLFAFSAGPPLSRALLMEYRATVDALSPSTVNVRLSAVRKMVFEARKNGMIGAEEAANLAEVPNIPQKGTRLGNWLTREQAKELLAVPDRSKLKGKRDYVVLAVLVGCALRREELAVLDVDTIQLREGRWVLVDLEGKGRRVRTVAIPVWVKQGINAWMTACRAVLKSENFEYAVGLLHLIRIRAQAPCT